MTKPLLEALRQATVALIVAAEKDSVADFPSGVDYGHLDDAWAALDATYPALWNEAQVAKINEWQSCGWVHPLTCANHNDDWHKDEDGDEVLPIAIPQGLVCRSCGHRQFFVPVMCLEGPPPDQAATFERCDNDRRPKGRDVKQARGASPPECNRPKGGS